MAYRRSITAAARAKFVYQQHKFSPSFSYINQHNDDDTKNTTTTSSSIPVVTDATKITAFLHNRSSFTSPGVNNHKRLSFIPTTHQFMHSMNFGSSFSRNMSTAGDSQGAEAVNTFDYLGDSADVFTDTASTAVEAVGAAVQQVDPLVSEVAVAAADSFFPVAGLQYLIDYVHTFTGLQWWGAIVVSTILIRLVTTPLVIHQMKATSKFTLIRPRIEAIRAEMENRGMSPAAVAEGQEEMQKLFKEYGVSPFTPMKGLFVQGPVFLCFFLAITNMVEKVPSFKEGGAFWFTDLTTPDSMYILPVLTALTFWITVECNMQEGMEGNPAAGVIKNVSRGFAVLTIPLTASFAKAIFCYWISSNVYSLFLGLFIKNHAIKKALGIPIIPVTPYIPGEHKPGMSFFESIKKYAEAQAQAKKAQQLLSSSSAAAGGQSEETQKQQNLSSPPAEASKPARSSVPSSSIISQRIQNLEREVKGRRKGKKK